MDDSGSEFVEEFCMIAGSHSSTLDRLYAWERKLYDEVKVFNFDHFKTSALFAFTLGFGLSIIFASFTIIVLPQFHDLE